MDAWNDITAHQDQPCKNCGLTPNDASAKAARDSVGGSGEEVKASERERAFSIRRSEDFDGFEEITTMDGGRKVVAN